MMLFRGQLSASVAKRLLQHKHTLSYLYLSVASDEQAAVLASLTPLLTHLEVIGEFSFFAWGA